MGCFQNDFEQDLVSFVLNYWDSTLLYLKKYFVTTSKIYFLLKATSVLGHKQRSSEPAVLPTSDEERHGHHKHLSLAADFDRKVEELDREFDKVITVHLTSFLNSAILYFFQ